MINGVAGGKLQDINKASFKGEVIHNSFFLDNTTGDIYFYNYEQSEWIPKSNAGYYYVLSLRYALTKSCVRVLIDRKIYYKMSCVQT